MNRNHPVHVLLVEDDPLDFAQFRGMIDAMDDPSINLVRASTLADALARLADVSFSPDIVITDLTLPDSKGLDTFRRISGSAGNLPIIVLSGIEDDALAVEAVGNGAQDFLRKRRIDVELLRYAIRSALARHAAEQALRESEERYALAVRGSNNGVWDWNFRTETIYFSPRWKGIVGCTDKDLDDSPQAWFTRIHPDDEELVREKLQAHIDGLTSHFQAEYRMRHRDGSWVWVLTRGEAVRDGDGVVTRIAGSHADVTLRKSAEEKLIHNAFHDELTGLPNRALFHDRLERSIRRLSRNPEHHFAIMFLDLDRFKHVNDSKGHDFGDRILIEVAKRLRDSLRPDDTVGRLGGDEFVVLAEDIRTHEDALTLADRIHDQLSTPVFIGEEDHFLSVSIGIALGDRSYQLPEQLIRDADTAMYRAKARGRSRSEVFNKAMHDKAVAILQLENDLRKAVVKQEFIVHYQPIVNLKTGRIRGFEALARWRHPDSGLIQPLHFIALAEEIGLIGTIGTWVLREAAKQIRVWQEQFPVDPPLTMNVNVSSLQLQDPQFVDTVASALEENNLPPRSLILELTESAIVDDYEQNSEVITRLRDIGVGIHIDDFGIGYSSLNHLKHFVSDSLKIDKSFFARMDSCSRNSEIVRSIVSLARNLGINSTAEGLETVDHLERARELECEEGQGFFFSEPRDSDEIEVLLASKPEW